MKYYIISGEASGDLHGSRLIQAIRTKDPKAIIRAWGGDKMEQAGATVVKHYRDLAFMGFAEVIANLPTILRNMRFCKQDIAAFHPDAVILIDYPGFNIPIAKFAKAHRYSVIYYISPQLWAWKEGRVHTLKRVVDRMLVILPFEPSFYAKWGMKVDYVGHPLIEHIQEFRSHHQPSSIRSQWGIAPDKNVIAILPGSRKQEISAMLPIMMDAAAQHPEETFYVAQAPGIEDAFITRFTAAYHNVKVFKDKTYELLCIAQAAWVTSGTATLETALFNVPLVVCYKGSPLSYAIAKRVIKVKYISLVNLILDRPVVPELIQDQLTANRLSEELHCMLHTSSYREAFHQQINELDQLLQSGGKASEKAESIIFDTLAS